MSTPLHLGIDFGTSGARACVIAAGDEIEAMERIEFGQLHAFEWVPSWREGLFDLLGALPAGARRALASLAIAATSGTVLACDESLLPSAEPMLYNDARAVAEAERIARAAGPEHPAATPSSGLAKVLWLRSRIGPTRSHLFLNQADWLTALLSELPGISDYHNALKMGFGLETRAWPDWVACLADIDSLPNAVPPGSAINRISRTRARQLGIAPDCVVCTGTTDSIAAFLAAGVDRPGVAVTSLGSTLVLKLLSTTRVDAARFGVYSHWFGALWLAGGASNAGGAVLAHHFSSDELSALSSRIDPTRPSLLDYYPLPAPGERFPVNDPDLPPRLDPRPDDRAEFLHGILEGLARIEAEGYRCLHALGATPLHEVHSTGGGARNPVYAAIRQRHLGCPVRIAREQEAAYGAARLACHGSALFPSRTP